MWVLGLRGIRLSKVVGQEKHHVGLRGCVLHSLETNDISVCRLGERELTGCLACLSGVA